MTFHFKQEGEPVGDATMWYCLEFDRTMTVREFVNEVLTERKDEWGDITINIGHPMSFFEGQCYEYRKGKLISSLPEELMDKKIQFAKANGGYSLMSYFLVLEGKNK